ncbi:MAG: hypothetical protein R2725_10700 [Solirubrobacterales bacterium]
MTGKTAAPRWTCDKCGVSVRRIDGEPVERPPSWTESDAGTFCLGCSRAMAADAAVDAAPRSCSTEERSRIRRKALIRFEIGRDPAAPDRTIAQACRTSTAAVAAVRRAKG